MSIRISELPREDELRFDAVIRIYQAAIEPTEQKPPQLLRRHLADPRYHFLIAETAGQLIGFSLVFIPESNDLWLVEYVAIDASLRSAGIGSRLFQASCDLARKLAPDAAGILEVDSPSSESSSSIDIARRLTFYARNGCRLIEGLNYILPLSSAGQPPPMQLLLTADFRCNRLEKRVLHRWLTIIYSEVYSQPSDDRRIAIMISQLPDIISLGEIAS